MPEELQEPQVPQETVEPGAEVTEPSAGAESPSGFTQEQLDEAVAQATSHLNEEIASLNASLSQKDEELKPLKAAADSGASQIASLRESRDAAVGKYRASLTAANPLLPAEMIAGDTIEAIDASVETAKGLVLKIQESLESQREAETVPAGAPLRTGPSTQGMSAREKITYGLGQSQK